MSKSLENRIRQMERELALMRRELRAGNQRTANPMMPRLGRHFAELDEDLLDGETAQAHLVAWTGGALADQSATVITIQDFQLGVDESLPAGTRLWVVWDKTVWTWISIYQPAEDPANHYAWLIEFVISETTGGLMRQATFTGGGMKATIDYVVDGNIPPLDGNDEITVYDDHDMAPLAVRNCKGWAARNEHLQTAENPRYQIIACDQMAMQCRAVLDGTLDFNTFEVPIRSIQPDSEAPMGAMPIEPYSTFALNPHNHQARNGSQVLLRWGSAFPTSGSLGGVPQQGYIVESVDQWGVYQPVDYRVNQATKAIEVRWALASTEISETDFNNLPWEPMFPSKNC